ncbi:hypothetical protein GQ55_3G223600 [Panicum hallii var. hallii]|uniref:Uncharacterized protein n=1 Tax=Panicum hallii var. hallii TaxID=1504633 RepID=A0A2T7ECA4_9POAL|nr:hypothetical protein GQ55_3G223600 [Panicum hallii var. hallii]
MIRCRSADPPTPAWPPVHHPPTATRFPPRPEPDQTRGKIPHPPLPSPPLPWTHVPPPPPRGVGWGGGRSAGARGRLLLPVCQCHPPCRGCGVPAHSISSRSVWLPSHAVFLPCCCLLLVPFTSTTRPATAIAAPPHWRRAPAVRGALSLPPPAAVAAPGWHRRRRFDRARRSLGVIYRLLPGLPLVSAAARR